MVDQVKVVADDQAPAEQSLRRNLTNRHIQLIAIGGAIGTGLFMGSGKTISLAGPSIIFVYMIIGFMLFFVMRAMGELLLSNLEYKSFSDFASDLLGPWAGYFTGWTYWFCWVVTGMADVVAITAYAQFWFPDLSDWVASLAVIVLLLTLNLATVKMFGEMEFWFAMIKIVAIVSLIVVGLVMVAMHFQSPTGVEASFAHLWNDGGWFPKGLSGFFAGFQIAVFAFVGIELVGTTAAETKDPEKSLPRAINSIPIRIIMFYVFALIVIMSVTPWSSVVPEKSPFVELFVLVGLPAAASVINFVVLTSAASSANSGVFSTSRMLFGLAQEGVAPKAFAKLSYIVFQADVIHQVINQFINTVIHRFPGGAGFRRRCDVIGGVFNHFQQFARFIVLAFHHADWSHCLAAHALFDHREEDLLFFHHVAGKLFMQHSQVFCQPFWHARFVGVNALDFSRLQDQLRQLLAVTIVVAHDDMVNDFCQRGATPVFLNRLFSKLCQFSFNDLNIQFFTCRRARQRLLTATAVIHIIFTKQSRSARDRERQFT